MNDIDQTALEIARAFIPVDVVGQQRANLQVAIIEAIKKHANPKTLADVQPGGRVRLWDAPWPEIDAILADAYSAGATGLPFEGIARRHAVRAAVAALSAQPSPDRSFDLEAMLAVCVPGGDIADPQVIADNIRHWFAAQPSPGGQDALATARELLAAEYDKAGERVFADRARKGQYDNDPDVHAIVAALAARQPVGEKEVVDAMVDKAWNRFEVALNAEDGDTPEDRVLSETIDQRDRYHEVADDLAGHIAAITGVEIGEHSSANCPWQNAIEAAEEYKPTQAVDLMQFRDSVVQAISNVSYMTGYGPAYEKLTELLALIDGKAVGK
ncbi:hypothetical protein [Stenotrophomonas sp. STK17_22]|uniref:hypothetical protein n=1 Tax=Stenotrophomonas sp. STK17_22 TaxID=3455201 RepID=UPI003F7FBF27